MVQPHAVAEQIERSDPKDMALAIAILVIIFVLLYFFGEKLKKNKYDPQKNQGKVWTRWGPWDINRVSAMNFSEAKIAVSHGFVSTSIARTLAYV